VPPPASCSSPATASRSSTWATPRAADEAQSKLNDARALIGDTIEGDDEPATADVRARPNSIPVPDVVAGDPTVWKA
jgi:hypothetical protein